MPFAGRTCLFKPAGFVARDTFLPENNMACEVLEGPAAGVSQYLITWQKNDDGTVVCLDDFEESLSFSHYTNASHEFFVMDGRISEAAE